MDQPAHDQGLPEEARLRLQRFKDYAISHTMLADIIKELKRAIVEPAGFSHVLLFGPSGVGTCAVIVVVFFTVALKMGKDQFATEALKAMLYLATGGTGGYFAGRQAQRPPPRDN